jgi:glycosyltransferase involved in cell wall biosynthesis
MVPLMKTTLLITTYRRPDALACVFESLEQQSMPADQVIIADDGSGAETRLVVTSWQNRLPLELVWQADSSFRAARIRNLALLRVQTEHLVMIDGDCILPPDFIEAHRRLISPRVIVSGGRALMTESETAQVLSGNAPVCEFSHYKFSSFPLGGVRDLRSTCWKQVRTCNMGVMTEEILTVAGFDEGYIGWGREDSDLVVRMLRNGSRIRSARFAATVRHLYHPEFPRERLTVNDEKFARLLGSKAQTRPEKSVILRQ